VNQRLKDAMTATAIGAPLGLLNGALPMIATNLIMSGQRGSEAAFLYVGVCLVWSAVLMSLGVYRLAFHRVWRPGLRPCMCDKPARCHRHHSSWREPNRPGVVAARLAESGDA
jgi:hypothetical protein